MYQIYGMTMNEQGKSLKKSLKQSILKTKVQKMSIKTDNKKSVENTPANDGNGNEEGNGQGANVSFGFDLLRPAAKYDVISKVEFVSIESGDELYMGALENCVRVSYLTEEGTTEVFRVNEINAKSMLTRFLPEGANFTKARYSPTYKGKVTHSEDVGCWEGFIINPRGESLEHWAFKVLAYDARTKDLNPDEGKLAEIFNIKITKDIGMLIYAEKTDRDQSEPSFGLISRLKIKTGNNSQDRQRNRGRRNTKVAR